MNYMMTAVRSFIGVMNATFLLVLNLHFVAFFFSSFFATEL